MAKMLTKLFEDGMEDVSYVDPELVNKSVDARVFHDTRKLHITFGMLNRLKRIRNKQTLERAKQEQLFALMYGEDAEGDEEGGGGLGPT